MRVGAVAVLIVCGLARAERYEGGAAGFDLPKGWRAEATADVSTELAWRVLGHKLTSVVVLIGTKRIGEADLDVEAGGWHAAHLRNRVAWGVRSDGGLPRDVLKLGARRAVRYRDKVRSPVGATDQTFTCTQVSGRLACVVVQGPPDSHDDADSLAAAILGSLRVKR